MGMEKDKRKIINELLNEIKRGKDECIISLYEIISPTLRYIALKYLKKEEDADDLVQDFWYDIKKYASNYIFKKNAYGYLCKIMNRMAINKYNKIHRETKKHIEFVDYSNIVEYDKNQTLEEVNLRNDISDAMLKLTFFQQVIIQETYFEGKTVRQIAKDTGSSKSQVSRQKIIAIEILKTELTKRGWDKEEV